jgi:hypothetical protein
MQAQPEHGLQLHCHAPAHGRKQPTAGVAPAARAPVGASAAGAGVAWVEVVAETKEIPERRDAQPGVNDAAWNDAVEGRLH